MAGWSASAPIGWRRAISPDERDPFRVADLAAAPFVADPARLHDEAAAQNLTGGRRLVRVRNAGDAVGALFERFLAVPPPGDSFVVVEAAELQSRSSLRRAFEAAKNAAAIPCYPDGSGFSQQSRTPADGSRICVAATGLWPDDAGVRPPPL